ncbi:unnamed protein product [Camellia sinensis]
MAQDFDLEQCAPSGGETGSATATIDGSKGKGCVLDVCLDSPFPLSLSLSPFYSFSFSAYISRIVTRGSEEFLGRIRYQSDINPLAKNL